MEVVDTPVLHNNAPVTFPAVSVEFPQLLVTVTDGVGGINFGTALPVATLLVHPLTAVCLTV